MMGKNMRWEEHFYVKAFVFSHKYEKLEFVCIPPWKCMFARKFLGVTQTFWEQIQSFSGERKIFLREVGLSNRIIAYNKFVYMFVCIIITQTFMLDAINQFDSPKYNTKALTNNFSSHLIFFPSPCPFKYFDIIFFYAL